LLALPVSYLISTKVQFCRGFAIVGFCGYLSVIEGLSIKKEQRGYEKNGRLQTTRRLTKSTMSQKVRTLRLWAGKARTMTIEAGMRLRSESPTRCCE
jgi:hypothetical protein